MSARCWEHRRRRKRLWRKATAIDTHDDLHAWLDELDAVDRERYPRC